MGSRTPTCSRPAGGGLCTTQRCAMLPGRRRAALTRATPQRSEGHLIPARNLACSSPEHRQRRARTASSVARRVCAQVPSAGFWPTAIHSPARSAFSLSRRGALESDHGADQTFRPEPLRMVRGRVPRRALLVRGQVGDDLGCVLPPNGAFSPMRAAIPAESSWMDVASGQLSLLMRETTACRECGR
jgi:hypothetical protein